MFKDRLKSLRNEKKLTQSELAGRLGVSVGSVKYWEQGKGEPNAAALLMMSYVFETSVDYILGLSNIRTINRTDADKQKILSVIEQLSPSGFDALMNYAEYLKDKDGGTRHV